MSARAGLVDTNVIVDARRSSGRVTWVRAVLIHYDPWHGNIKVREELKWLEAYVPGRL